MKSALKVFGVLLLVSIAAPVASETPTPKYPAPPTDAQMIENLRKHRKTFEKLVAMIRKDHVLRRVDDNWTDPADPSKVGISSSRIAEYRRIMKSIGIPRGFYYFPSEVRHNDNDDFISFLAYAVGLSVSGMSKSYVWSEVNPDVDGNDLVMDLDAFRKSGSAKTYVYRHIEGHWYLNMRID